MSLVEKKHTDNGQKSLSIVIPVYNVKDHLQKCLNSLCKQTNSSWECILVDDGSSDGSEIICDEYACNDSRFRVFHKKNGGVSTARNLGIEKASFEIISFIDADDCISSDYVDVILQEMSSKDLLFFAHSAVLENDYTTTFQRHPFAVEGKSNVESSILKLKTTKQGIEVFSFTWNKAFRRKIITENNIRFIEGLSTREDEVFTNQYCQFVNVLAYVDKPIYLYSIVNTGLTARFKSFNDLKLLAYHLNKSTDWFINKQLYSVAKARALSFGLDAAFSCFFPRVSYFGKLRKFYGKHKKTCFFSKKIKLIFNHSLLISFLCFYTIVPAVHAIRSFRTRVK
jgi:glycosyltransferase involved in cell wall biosynthesis